MKSKSALHIVAIFLIFPFLSGCSVRHHWFIRNLTDKEVLLTLNYQTVETGETTYFLPLRDLKVRYKDTVLKIDHETSLSLNDSLEINPVNKYVYKINIPPQSTLEVTNIIPTGYANDNNIVAVFYQGGKLYSVNSSSAFDKRSAIKRTGGLLIKNLMYCDYKAQN